MAVRVGTRSKIWIIKLLYHLWLHVFSHGSTALGSQGLLTAETSRSHSDTPQLEGLLQTSDQPVAETHNNHKTQEYMPPPLPPHRTGIRTRNPSKRVIGSVFLKNKPYGTPLCIRPFGLRKIICDILSTAVTSYMQKKKKSLCYMKHDKGDKLFALIPTELYYLSCQRHSKNTSDRTKHSLSQEPLEDSLWANGLSNLFSFPTGPSLHNKTHTFFTQSAAVCHPPPPLILVN